MVTRRRVEATKVHHAFTEPAACTIMGGRSTLIESKIVNE